MATASGASPAALRFARLLFGVAAVVGFSVVVYLAWIPVPQAVSHFAVEDIGYYLTAARNVANGNGVTLDGHNATNGFHPLWLALLCLEAWPFKGSPETLFHLALTTCAMFFGATCLVVYRDVRSRMIAWLAPPVAALLLCNYRLASIALGGLETALVGFSTIVTISFIARSDGAFTLGRAAGLGALLGAASLSRMDALLFGGIVLAWLGCRALPAGPARTG